GTSTAAALQAAVPAGGALTVVVEDAAGNLSAPSAPTLLTTDFNPPSVSVTADSTKLATGQSAVVTFLFTESGVQLPREQIQVAGGTLSALTALSSGLGFTATFTPDAGAEVAMSVAVPAATYTDRAGNVGQQAGSISLTGNSGVGVSVTRLSASNPDGAYRAGQVIVLTAEFNGPVTVTGVPVISLNTTPARLAAYRAGSGTRTLEFAYTVQAGDAALRLEASGVHALLSAGGSITRADGGVVSLLLPEPGSPTSLSAGKSIVIDTKRPDVLVLSERGLLISG
ncbi:MAG: Ig-like domain-containing protein, partial [Opitutaceae bacterium]